MITFCRFATHRKRVNRTAVAKNGFRTGTGIEGFGEMSRVLEEENIFNKLNGGSRKQSLKHIQFLTEKPMILVINVDEKQLVERDYPGRTGVLTMHPKGDCRYWRSASNWR